MYDKIKYFIKNKTELVLLQLDNNLFNIIK